MCSRSKDLAQMFAANVLEHNSARGWVGFFTLLDRVQNRGDFFLTDQDQLWRARRRA
jgi:hypothetical protein